MRKVWLLAAAVFLMQASWAQQPTFLVPGLYPALKIQNMRPAPSSNPLFSMDAVKGMPNVASWTWLPDGRLFIATMDDSADGEAWEGTNGNVLGPSKGIMFSNLSTAADSSGVTASLVVNGFHEPLGTTYANGSIYVDDDQNGILQLVDSSGGYSKKTIYSGLLGHLTGKGGTTNAGDRRWDAGLLYRNGFFYSEVGMGFPQGGQSDTTIGDIYRGRGTILKVSSDGSEVDTFSGGWRNGVSLEWGPDSANGDLWAIDNQGSWRPESGLFDVRQGRFYGHPFTPYDNQAMYPPAVIFPYGTGQAGTVTAPFVSACPTDILWLKSGPYLGQMLVGENHASGINRVFLEKTADGEYQGALFPFSQGLGVGSTGSSGTTDTIRGVNTNFRASVNKLSYGPDGNIYIGGGSGKGANSGGAWGFQSSNQWGLARLVWKDTTIFEMKAIRSKGPTTMEVEFTEPVNASTVVAANFTVRQFNDVAGGTGGGHGVSSYGAGQNVTNTALQVNTATLDSTKTKVTLNITGLLARSTTSYNGRDWGYVQQIQANGVTAVSGHTIWGGGNQGGGVGWYTTNTFGPGTDAPPPGIVTNIQTSSWAGSRSPLLIRWASEGVWVRSPTSLAYTLRVMDLNGKTVGSFSVGANKAEFLVPAGMVKGGLNVLELKTAGGQRWTSMVTHL